MHNAAKKFDWVCVNSNHIPKTPTDFYYLYCKMLKVLLIREKFRNSQKKLIIIWKS